MSRLPSTVVTAGSTALFTSRALIDELLRGGVREVCVAPGSRSTALALAVAERKELASTVVADERSMGFFALGIARATSRPVAILCTSGTAAANLLPAVVESAFGGGALVVLTADRPPELRDCAAAQTIEQVGLFGRHPRWSADVPILDPSIAAARALRSIAARAVAEALAGRGGPVHLNVPLREPFSDRSFPLAEPFEIAAREGGRPFTQQAGSPSLSAPELDEIAARIAGARRGVIVCAGCELPAASIARLAAALGWPVLADPLSGLRFGRHDRSHIVAAVEPLLRDERIRARLRPDFILRLGLTPAASSVQRWLEESWPAEQIVVDGSGSSGWPDPVRAASMILRADAAQFCDALAAALPEGAQDRCWLSQWQSISAIASRELDAGLAAAPATFDAIVLRSVVAALPEGSTLVVGNSMPVRDADAFLAGSSKRLRVLANRGASGIDGVVSTALGVAAACGTPAALLLGDLSFLHDAAALAMAARERIPLLIVVVNNDGGAIFSYLPLRESLERTKGGPAAFERYFSTPHGADLERVAALAGGFFARVENRRHLDATIASGLAATASGPAIIEVRTDREAGRLAQLRIVEAAQSAVLCGIFPSGTGTGPVPEPVPETARRRSA